MVKGQVLSNQCPSRQILLHLTSRWAVLVLFCLKDGTHRFSALKKRIEGVSEKMLIETLKTLEKDGFVQRIDYLKVPPKVEYSLTALGMQAANQVAQLFGWIEDNLQTILDRDE